MSLFSQVSIFPPDPIFAVANLYNASKLKEKALLAVGVYCTETGQPYLFPSVSKAEDNLLHKNSKNYLPMTGHPGFVKEAQKLLFGPVYDQVKDRLGSVQTAAGSGALQVISEFSLENMHFPKVLMSKPTWANYYAMFHNFKTGEYNYMKNLRLDLPGMVDSLNNSPEGSLVVLQACCHNPCGIDPRDDQWDEILHVIKKKNQTPLFDFAYMGWATGDTDKDAAFIRKFSLTGYPFFVGFSFSKCMGLYGERIGCVHAICNNHKEAVAVESRFAGAIRRTISVAPQNGALIVNEVLSNPDLHKQWLNELATVSKRVIKVRGQLVDKLEHYTNKDWSFIREQRGLFALTGLTPSQVSKLGDNGVFIPENGRISCPSLNPSNIDFVARAISKSLD